MLQDIRIGLTQFEAKVGDTERNLQEIIRIAEAASSQGVSLLCYPECALHGYSPKDASEIADPLDSTAVARLRECARDLGLLLLVGMVEKSPEGKKPYISQLIVFPDREPEVYRKVHLGRIEQHYFTAGDSFPIFAAVGVRFSVGICWDWHFPELSAICSLKGAEIQFAPHASPVVSGDRKEIWKRYLGARAYDNSVYLCACNLVGTNNRDKEFSGGILVFGPKGEVLAENQDTQEQLFVVDLPAKPINTLRSPKRQSMRDTFFLADRRKELYKELLELEIEKMPQMPHD
ncbi:nitrilase family protein [Desulfitobacterium chlororespirans]|uniref:Predicted amidohydrolase n=1 Tax=Desulfitobacterium chlororespirans DSM 11544 TaxID=1121395 RepID=A0A1M7UZA4_9FIRM|nr:nitrilase family protein [Desulfitobacterium chlororespirans]SHN88298.1 Predicted amidohydrolase [Desulfitobacterium chlororespirans DSM 11544]